MTSLVAAPGDALASGRSGAPEPNLARQFVARIIIWAHFVAAVLAAVFVLSGLRQRGGAASIQIAFEMLNIPLSASPVSAIGLALLAGALLRRKRAGLVIVGVFQVLGLVFGVIDIVLIALDYAWRDLGWILLEGVGVLASIGILWVLWWVRPSFPARLTRGSWVGGTLVLIVGALLTIGATHLLLVSRGYADWSNLSILRVALTHALGFADVIDTPEVGRVPRWIPLVAAVLLSLSLSAAAWVFLRSARRGARWEPANEVRIRRMLAQGGSEDSLGYFATRRDKQLMLSPDGRAGITYRVAGSAVLASGDPLGDPASWPGAITQWLAYARRFGLLPGVISAGEPGARAYAAQGLQVLTLGDEAVLRPATFAINSTTLTPVRRAARRAARDGVTISVRRHGDVAPEELARLGDLAARWRHGSTERGFSMALNRFGDPADADCVLVLAVRAGEPIGLLSFVPWGRRGLSLDLMRRAPQAPNGITEAMVTELMAVADGLGITQVSLNFAVLRHAFAEGDRFGAPAVSRLNAGVLGFLDRFLQLERLYRSNEKYRPEWVPRYLCFDGALSLPRLLIAAGRLEGFLPGPGAEPERRLPSETLAEIAAIAPPEPAALPAPERNEQSRHRLAHAAALAEAGTPAYPVGLPPNVGLADWTPGHDPQAEAWISGRIRALRDHGGVLFADLLDRGESRQLVVERDRCPRQRDFARFVDSGDLVVVRARAGRSRNGTESLLVTDWTLAAKCLQPVPWRGWDNPEQRLRRRATDLLVHPAAVATLRARSAMVAALRETLGAAGFAEVETPMLATVQGGATARPFRTHINAYGLDLTLRIAPELALKKLLVGGLGPVFEIGRNFRNEGADATHNPEFTSLEAYLPYADYLTMADLTERLVQAAATAVHARPVLPIGGQLLDIGGRWPRVPMAEAVSRAVGEPVDVHTDLDRLLSLAGRHGVAVHDGMGPGAVLEELYAELVEAETVEPTFFIDFPEETSPLTAPHRRLAGVVERWDLVVNRMELGTAYSELTDPVLQRRRLTDQSLKAAAGDPEAMSVDEDFLLSLEYGMPPAGGLGVGVDRLAMLITGASSIRDVLTFGFVKPV